MKPSLRENIGMLFWIGLISAGLLGCSSIQDNPHFKTLSEGEITARIEDNTRNQKIYDGFMNKMDVSATLQNEAVGQALLDQGARIYQWDASQYANEKSKADSLRASKTEIFLSFFVPERKWDDLHKPATKWKIFLDAGGKRFEGKATRWKSNLVEVQSFYPHHTRWSTPYKITFDVPTREIENTNCRLTITGPVGVVQMDFGPVALNRGSEDTPASSAQPFDTPAHGESSEPVPTSN